MDLSGVDKEFIEARRRSLKRYLQILCRHPTIYDTDIIKFFLTFQGTSCADNMKATYKNVLDEFSSESQSSLNSNDNIEKHGEDSDGIQMFRISQTHISFLHQQFNQIRGYLKSINEKNFKNANDFANIEKTLQTIGSDSTSIDRWATGPNDYWPTIQVGLSNLPVEIDAISERINEQYKRDDEVINDHFDLLIELLQGYTDLCKRFEDALQIEQKAIQKANNQQKRSSTATDTSSKNDNNLEMIAKRNRHALQCVQIETQLVYANLEAFVYILSILEYILILFDWIKFITLNRDAIKNNKNNVELKIILKFQVTGEFLYNSEIFRFILSEVYSNSNDTERIIYYLDKVSAHRRSLNLILKTLEKRKSEYGQKYKNIQWSFIEPIKTIVELKETPSSSFDKILLACDLANDEIKREFQDKFIENKFVEYDSSFKLLTC
ncbi:unnamed protein product [Rotaria sp. Silwood2]|nr:unnamed protein product [Rotaria sp. Silwood2]